MRGINNLGQIVGASNNVTDTEGHGFLYAGGKFSTIEAPGGVTVLPWGINDAGQMVGYFGSLSQGFLYSAGTFSTIAVDVPTVIGPVFGTAAFGINNRGDIVGVYAIAVPEPGTLVLFSVGLLGLRLAWRRRR